MKTVEEQEWYEIDDHFYRKVSEADMLKMASTDGYMFLYEGVPHNPSIDDF